MNKSEEGKADKRLFSRISSLAPKHLIGGILDFLSFRELRPLFYAVKNKRIRKNLEESDTWKRCLLSSMSYLTYLDQIFIRLNEKMYWSVFQDVFANDIKNFENKLASIEISDEIRDKFAFNSDCGKIVSPAMYFWVKIMSMENIAFDILALTQQDFDDYYLKQNDGYCSDIQERKIDLNLWEVVKDILSKSSKGRVDKIFNKFKDRQIGDYEIETFDSYARESGKKFDECENREIVWLNLCATLKGNIENEYSDLKNKAGRLREMTFGLDNRFGQVYDAVKSIYSLENAFAAYLFLFNPSNYKKFVEGLISKHKELQGMKNWIRNGFYTQEYKIDAAKLIEDLKIRRDIFEYGMVLYSSYVFNGFGRNYTGWYIEDKASVGSIRQSEQEASYITIMSMLFANSPDKINSVIDTAFLDGVKKNINAICENGKIVVIEQKYSNDYIQYFEENETWNKSEDINKYKDDTAIYRWTFNGSADKVLADLNLASEKMASLEQNSNNANIENDDANIYEQWRNKVESQLKSCKKYLMSDHAPEFVQNDSRNSNFINNFTKINQEQPTSLYIDDIIKDMQNNERYIQNYIDGKSMEVENDQENNFDKNEVERKDEQNIEIQENINVGENNNNRSNNIEIKNELATNKNDRNTDENRNNDKKLDLNGSNSQSTDKFKDVNDNIGNTHDPSSIGDSEKLEIRRLNDSNNRMQNDYLNNNKDQNITIDDDRNNREEHGNENRVKNSLRIKNKNSDIANENQDDTKKNESDIHNYIDRKSTEVENDQEDDSDKSEFERKDEQNTEIQENINLGEINNNRPDNIEIKNEPVTNKNDRNTDENRNNDKKLDLNGSNSQSTDKFKDVNDSNNIGNAQDLNSIGGNEKLEIKRLNDSNNGMQNDYLNNNKDQNITINDDRNNREEHGNENKIKNNIRNQKNKNINSGQSENGKDGELEIKDKNKSEIKYENPNNKQVTKSQRKPTVLWIILAIIFSPTIIFLIIFGCLACQAYKFNCELEKNALQTLKDNGQKNPKYNQNKNHEQQIPAIDIDHELDKQNNLEQKDN